MSELTAHLSQLETEPIDVVLVPERKELSLEELMANGIENWPESEFEARPTLTCVCQCSCACCACS